MNAYADSARRIYIPLNDEQPPPPPLPPLDDAIVSENVPESEPAAFFTLTYTLNIPNLDGVPVIVEPLSVNPSGRPDTDHVSGFAPDAVSVYEYASPILPFGSDDVMIAGFSISVPEGTVNAFTHALKGPVDILLPSVQSDDTGVLADAK